MSLHSRSTLSPDFRRYASVAAQGTRHRVFPQPSTHTCLGAARTSLLHQRAAFGRSSAPRHQDGRSECSTQRDHERGVSAGDQAKHSTISRLTTYDEATPLQDPYATHLGDGRMLCQSTTCADLVPLLSRAAPDTLHSKLSAATNRRSALLRSFVSIAAAALVQGEVLPAHAVKLVRRSLSR